jgi:uncharacterized protein YjbI with pentapeptide repeats
MPISAQPTYIKSNFDHAKLCRASFHVSLQAASLLSDLTGASFRGADLSYADLTGAILQNVDFTGADLTGTIFTQADLTGAILPAGFPAQ